MAITRYGVTWPEKDTDLMVELRAFRAGTKKFGGDEDNRPYHFKKIVSTFWGKNSKKRFQWNPWNERMLEAACSYKWITLSGSASCGKSYFMAMWGIVNWLSDPANTLVLYTSTGLKESKRRIWGDVEEFFAAAVDAKGKQLLPGKLISSQGHIRTVDAGVSYSEKSGLHLIPGDRAKEKENIGKLIGMHTKRIFLMADELPELSPALITAAKSNLATAPTFQMIGSGNFKGLYDPFGEMSEPKDGWKSVDEDFDEWETKDGVCLRFDGLRSPNVLLGRSEYVGIYGPEELENHKKNFPVTSPDFWRMCRSFPCSEADVNKIYSDSDMLKGDVKSPTVRWKDTPKKWASLDPAFANGGDNAVASFGVVGDSIEGHQKMLTDEQKDIYSNVKIKTENRPTQVAKEFIRQCKEKGIPPEHVAYDGSGGGIVFGDLLNEFWPEGKNKFLAVQFGGAASNRPTKLKSKDKKTLLAHEVFANRVAEIWFAGVDYVTSGQVKGLTTAICMELVERRRKQSEKGAQELKRKIETKPEMKARTKNKSPDHADSWLIGLEVCRERLGFTAIGMEGQRVLANHSHSRRLKAVNRMFQNATHEHAYADAA